MDMKLVVLVRQDLKLPKGKLAAQVAHAAVEAALRTGKVKRSAWRVQGQKKVVLRVKDEAELLEYEQKAKGLKLKTALITDAGRTCVAPGTTTCLGVGPDIEKKIDLLTGRLPML